MRMVLECQMCITIFNNVGDGMPPCGTPVLNWRCVDVLVLNVL